MHRIAVVLASVAYAGHGHRVANSTGQWQNGPLGRGQKQAKAADDASHGVQSLAEVSQSRGSNAKNAFIPLGGHLSVQPQSGFGSGNALIPVAMDMTGIGESKKWEATNNKLMHRWMTAEDPTFKESDLPPGVGSSYKTPEKFVGTRKDGARPGSSRVQFTLPGKEDEPVTIDLLRSMGYDNPSFGAVRVGLPLGATVYVKNRYGNARVVVRGVQEGSNAEKAGIREDDIIRGVSLSQSTDSRGFLVGTASACQDAEHGMLILEGESASVRAYNEALQQHERANERSQEPIVLLIERPITVIAKQVDGEQILRAWDSYADDLRELERETKVGSSTVYIARMPFDFVLDGLDAYLQDAGMGQMYPSFLEHSVVLVQHGGQQGCMAYDFVPENDLLSITGNGFPGANLARAIGGAGVPGVWRKWNIRRFPRRTGTQRVGVVRADMGSPEEVDRAIEVFSNRWDKKMVFFENDCRHYAGALLRLLVEGRTETMA